MEILTPRPLRPCDRVAIVSPAGIIKPQIVYKSMPVLVDQGWTTYVGAHTFDRYETYAGTDDARYADLEAALTDPDTRAIICSRGGYGAVHLLDRLNRLPLREDPKWIVGYSDISALHALMTRHGIESIHAPMCKHIAGRQGRDEDSRRLFGILSGERRPVSYPAHPLNRPGTATARLTGGNLAVIAGLISTPFDVITHGTILFIEDIAEPIYKVERILYNLRLNGSLGALAGLIVGRFTDYTPGAEGQTMEDMIARMVEPYDFPVAFGTPVGHVDHNIPLICSAAVTLNVGPDSTEITYV
ncbi:LD-carboxypeptidase [uncultured Duncaniella sp.]|uniref:S66 peptidase family protein n=1 Tax=uncultured Duncaniella sp. TaxID=2768039 RepID=UPI002675F78A|nr:LD-carboxypeptidase [uncultured Duncaniella sp.]MCI9171551.1 LD-carboxypeptidase [Muribaculaceae bacterium]